MPSLATANCQHAVNHPVSGVWVRWRIVPAVTEVRGRRPGTAIGHHRAASPRLARSPGTRSHSVCEQLKTEFEAWSRRRLDDVELDYLFLDGSHFKYHANAAAEPVLAA